VLAPSLVIITPTVCACGVPGKIITCPPRIRTITMTSLTIWARVITVTFWKGGLPVDVLKFVAAQMEMQASTNQRTLSLHCGGRMPLPRHKLYSVPVVLELTFSEVLAALGKVKSNLDSGVFQAVQEAGITALNAGEQLTEGLRKVYQERRDVLVPGLAKLGLEVEVPQAAFYVWIAVPSGYTSASFTAHLLEKAGIVTTPGNGFGPEGEGYIRMTLTTSKERLGEAVERIREAGF
jgi:hypothetical protein